MADTLTPAEALEAWRSDERLPLVLRACHPSMAGDTTLADTADDDLVSMVTVAAIAAGRPVRVIPVGTGLDLLATLQRIATMAGLLGRTLVPEMHRLAVVCRWEVMA